MLMCELCAALEIKSLNLRQSLHEFLRRKPTNCVYCINRNDFRFFCCRFPRFFSKEYENPSFTDLNDTSTHTHTSTVLTQEITILYHFWHDDDTHFFLTDWLNGWVLSWCVCAYANVQKWGRGAMGRGRRLIEGVRRISQSFHLNLEFLNQFAHQSNMERSTSKMRERKRTRKKNRFALNP